MPRPVQDFAHQVSGAPAAHRSPLRLHQTPQQTASRLRAGCRHARTRGRQAVAAAGFARPARAAGGAGKVGAYLRRGPGFSKPISSPPSS
jgi:hypothetical protein